MIWTAAVVVAGILLAYIAWRVLALLIALVVTAGVGSFVVGTIDAALAEELMHQQQSNHARFEGTWTPRELRDARFNRLMDEAERPVHRHAEIEGAESAAASMDVWLPTEAYEAVGL